MEEQLEQAVSIALQGNADASLKQQAIEYCNQVKNSENGWQICLAMFTGSQKRSEAARFFSLQVIDSRLTSLGSDEIKYIRDNLYPYVRQLMDVNNGEELEPFHMRNKLAQTLGFLFILTYANDWPSFFDDILSIAINPIGNGRGVDMYLRILKVIHEEIGDHLILRSPEETKRNNMLKDLVRERAMNKLANSWMNILEYYGGAGEGEKGINGAILNSTLNVIGGWVSWIDITLIVNPSYLTLIFNQLTKAGQRLSACDTLTEIISKKMQPSHKLELIELLNLTNVLAELKSKSVIDAEFEERIAKLCNVVGLELVHITDGTTTVTSGAPCSQQEMDKAEQLMVNLLPIILEFLSNEYDDTSVQVLQCLSEYLQFIRREVKKEKAKVNGNNNITNNNVKGKSMSVSNTPPPDSSFIPHQRREIVSIMLNKIILKMEYDNSTDWTGGEDESESEFLELRNKLKVLQDQIAGIDSDLFVDGISTIIGKCFDESSNKWQTVELGLYELSAFGDSIRNGSIMTTKGVETRATQTFYELFVKMINSNVITINHPSIQLWYMELVNRHSQLFTAQQPQVLSKVLEVFVSPLGVHNDNKKVQVRSWYLFYRFLKTVKNIIGSDISKEIFTSLAPLLVIRAELPNLNDNDSEMSADAAISGDGIFDAQLYLFELLGILFSYSEDNNQTPPTQELIQSVYTDIERCLSISNGTDTSNEQQQIILQVHHNLMVLGTFARGFDDTNAIRKNTNKMSIQNLKSSANVILVVLERLSKFEIIRDSARFAFSRLIPILGVEILEEISKLISVLLNNCNTHEFPDFLSFLGQLVHSFRTQQPVFEMFGSLTPPLIDKVFIYLNEDKDSNSTDEVILKRELRRSYLQFILNVVNNGFGSIFIIGNNSTTAFGPIMESLFHYSSDLSDSSSQKLAIATLGKMMIIWGSGQVSPDPYTPTIKQYGEGLKVPGFDNQTILEQYSQTCWTLPTKPGFDNKDAQIRFVIGELATLQKILYEHKGRIYTDHLINYLSNLGLPSNLCEEYMVQLSQLKQKEFKKFFIDFIIRVSS